MVAVQVEVDDNDDKTIRFAAEPAIRGTIFDGFGDFNLDLSCLSAPSSPTPSTSILPPDTPSPPSSPILSRSTSFISRVSPLPQKKSKKKLSSPHLGATTGSTTTARGSWPLIKYAGRGTPIDRNRRLEWGGFSGEEVAEDGILFSTARSTSLDSAIRPSQWSHISAISSSHSRTASSESTSRGDGSAHEQPPELAPILIDGLGADKSDEWDSIMKTVLASSSTEAPPSDLTEDVSTAVPSPAVPSAVPAMPHHPDSELEVHGLEIDLGLNAALDLGLGRRGGTNWFDLGLLPKSTNGGADTPSVYSSRAPTPRPSPPPSVRIFERRSTSTSTKAEGNGGIIIKTESHPWWRRFLLRIRKVQSLMTVHKSRF